MKAHEDDQPLFDFDVPPAAKAVPLPPTGGAIKRVAALGSPEELRRAAVGWLAAQNPTGLGVMVATRIARFQADVAAFWSRPMKLGDVRTLVPYKTAIVDVRRDRTQCWPDCARQAELLSLLRAEKEKREKLETEIRQKEPGLRRDDSLFADYQLWDYAASENRKYHKCLRDIEELERALYNGSRFERVRQARVADYLYLAVPAGEVHPHELADSWGLLYVNPDLTVTLIKEAENWECPLENKTRLVQNIAAACVESLLFAKGVQLKGATPKFVRPPRRRRAG